MTSNIFSTIVITSDFSERFNEAVLKNEKVRTAEQLRKLHQKMDLIQRLENQGMLFRQEFQPKPSANEFNTTYSHNHIQRFQKS